MPDIHPMLYVTGAIALVVVLVRIGRWVGRMDEHKSTVSSFMEEIRDDIKRILRRLPSPTVAGHSPLSLTDLGEQVATELEASQWAKDTADQLWDRVKDLPPYDIQDFCFNFVQDEFSSSGDDKMSLLIKTCAYQNGLDIGQVTDVLAIVLRDELVGRLG